MSRVPVLQITAGLLAGLLASAGGGFAVGLLHQSPGAAARAAQAAAAATTAAPREAAPALQALGAHGHWGAYRPQEGEAQAAAPATRPAPDLEGIARDFRLVGIERRGGTPLALLLPADAADGSTEVIRLRTGEALAEGISVSAIGTDSVRFSTTGGDSTLYLYGPLP